MSAPNSIHEQKKMRFVAASFEGAPAIFAERPHIVHIQITSVLSDDWGMKATITDSRLPGMQRLPRSSCLIAAAWDVFELSTGDWQAHYVPWRLFFDPLVIEGCLARATEKAKTGRVIEWDDGHKIFGDYYARVSEEFQKRANALRRPRRNRAS